LQNASGLTPVPMGNSSLIRTGNAVVALGNAEGRGIITAKPGHVTGLHQTITASDKGGSTTSETLHGMIQTNAGIVPGDSGGPLASSAGVIGMDTAGNDPGYQQASTGFAIPINTALAVARQIAAGHASSAITIGYPPFLGIFIGSGSAKSPQAQARQQGQGASGSGSGPACSASNADLTVPSVIAPVSSGVLIDGTICGSPAASAGMTGGAVITAVNGQPVGSPDDLASILSRFHPGDTISVTWVSPSGQRTTRNLHLTAGPPQ
jgi:S1-C subfamily serine protease